MKLVQTSHILFAAIEISSRAGLSRSVETRGWNMAYIQILSGYRFSLLFILVLPPFPLSSHQKM